MKYRKLGKSELYVSAVGLGCNNFGHLANMDVEESRKVIDKALEVGINFFDTSSNYGSSEIILGEVLGERRKKIVLATKVGGKTSPNGQKSGVARSYILAEVEESLRRLRTDWIDLYQIHYPDPKTPIEETLLALDDLVKQGKVRYIGCSNFSTAQLNEAQKTAAERKFSSFVSSQDQYSLIVRNIERELLPAIEQHGMGEIPYLPLASGLLTGKYKMGQPAPTGSRFARKQHFANKFHTAANLEKVERLEQFAAKYGHTLLELAFSWLLARSVVASVIAGATTPEQIEKNAKAAALELSAEELAGIDRINLAAEAAQ